MRPLTTGILFAVSVILGIAIWWTDREPAEGDAGADATAGAGKVLARVETDLLSRVVVKGPAGEAVLEKRDGYWHFTQPVEDRADPEAMGALLDLLSHLTVLDRIPIDEVGSSEELGAEALGLTGGQVVRVEMTEAPEGGEARTHAILLGKPTPLANSIYARIPDSEDRPDVYVVNGTPGKYLEDPVAALRDRHLFLAPADQIVQINVRTPKGEIEMKRKIVPPVADWTLTKPLQTLADAAGIESLIAGLAGLRVESVLSTGGKPEPVPNPVPDGSVAIDVWRYGVETPLKLYLKPAAGEAPAAAAEGAGKPLPLIEARVSDRSAVFQVRSDLLETLPATPNGFRNPHLASIPPTAVFGIAIESRGNPPVVLKTARTPDGVRWFSERNGAEEPANTAQIAALIKSINEERVLDFVSDTPDRLAEFNLSPPAVQVAISHYERLPDTAPDGAAAGGGGQLGIVKRVLQLGYTEGAGAELHKLYANFAGEPFIQEISPAFREKVLTHPLKWKDLKLITFNPISLRSIERVIGGDEASATKLTYDYRRDAWSVSEGGVDVSEQINKDAARKLRDVMGSLSANRWLIPSPQAFQAIEMPAAEFRVTLERVDRASGKAGDVVYTVRFARSAAHSVDGGDLSYYGRLDDSPDLFEIGRDTFRDLIAPLLLRRVGAPQ
jgi:hypothetical protein